MYFLNDFAEFGRKVKIKKAYPATHITNNYKSLVNTNGYRGSYLKGRSELGMVIPFDTSYARLSGGIVLGHATRNGEHFVSNLSGVNKKFDYRKTRRINTDKKPIILSKEDSKKLPSNTVAKTNKTTPTSSTTSFTPKSSSRSLNKYTLGAAGVLGTGLAGVAGYKYLTRNKKKEGNK